ncbi:hypothetical protein, partial [Streptococcus anginosus]|uniref:hypothetical protein n=1 Tax=Streptococcus anginosus TaxID=1328 RepID=UPI002EDA7CDE
MVKAVEDPSVLEMAVLWDDHQEQQQQWSEVSRSVECYRWQSWRSEPSLSKEPQKIMCGFQTLEQSINLKLPWRPQDIKGARA